MPVDTTLNEARPPTPTVWFAGWIPIEGCGGPFAPSAGAAGQRRALTISALSHLVGTIEPAQP